MRKIDPDTPIWQLSVGEFMSLLSRTQEPAMGGEPAPAKRMVYGIAGIASLFNCSTTTAHRIKASGKIDKAISQTGRMISVDADLALKLLGKDKGE